MRVSKGFTMIELLIVLAILATLAVFVIVRLVGPQKGARDTRRQSDLRQYQASLERYANANNGLYPIRTSATTTISLCSSALGASSCPDDPQAPTQHYYYQTDAAGLRYVLWARLEKPTTQTFFVLCSSGEVGTASSVSGSGGNCPI